MDNSSKNNMDFINNLNNLSEDEKNELNEFILLMLGIDNGVDILIDVLNKLDISVESFEESEQQHTFAVKKANLSETFYFDWIVEYLSRNKKLASYHSRGKDKYDPETALINSLKYVYEGIIDYAIKTKINPVQGNDVVKDYYFVLYNNSIISFGSYVFDGNVVCEFADHKLVNKDVIIDANDIIDFYKKIEYKKGSSKKRK